MADVKMADAGFVFWMNEDAPKRSVFGEPYAHLYLNLGTLNSYDGKWTAGGIPTEFEHFYRVVVSCQSDPDHAAKGCPAYATHYTVKLANTYGIRLHEAEMAVKALRFIDKGMTRLFERFGEAQTFGEFCARVADVLAVQYTISLDPSEYTTSGKREIRNCDLAHYIDRRIAGWWQADAKSA
jgi:hypothetical protein